MVAILNLSEYSQRIKKTLLFLKTKNLKKLVKTKNFSFTRKSKFNLDKLFNYFSNTQLSCR